MKTSIDMVKVDGNLCAAAESSERHESQCRLKGFRLSIPTPTGVVALDIDEYEGGRFDKESGAAHYCQDGSPQKDVSHPANVTEGYKFAGLVMTTLVGSLSDLQNREQQAKQNFFDMELKLEALRHQHKLELMRLTDELEGAKHARIQAAFKAKSHD